MGGHHDDDHNGSDHEDIGGGGSPHHTTKMSGKERSNLLYVRDHLGSMDLQSVKVSSSPKSSDSDSDEDEKGCFTAGGFKWIRYLARRLATRLLCRAHFSPKYVWKNGIIGSTRQYVGIEDEHHEPWTGLFVDLIYVAMCSKLAHILMVCQLDFEILFLVGNMMFLFFLSRFFIDEYNIRFESDGIFHRVITFLYIAGICVMLVNSNIASGGSDDGHRRLSSFEMTPGMTPHDSVEQYHRMLAAAAASGEAKPFCTLDSDYFHQFSIGFHITRVSLILLLLGMMLIDQSNRVFYMFAPRVVCLLCSVVSMLVADLAVHDTHMKVWPLMACVLFEFIGYISGGIIVFLKKAGRWNYLVGTMCVCLCLCASASLPLVCPRSSSLALTSIHPPTTQVLSCQLLGGPGTHRHLHSRGPRRVYAYASDSRLDSENW